MWESGPFMTSNGIHIGKEVSNVILITIKIYFVFEIYNNNKFKKILIYVSRCAFLKQHFFYSIE